MGRKVWGCGGVGPLAPYAAGFGSWLASRAYSPPTAATGPAAYDLSKQLVLHPAVELAARLHPLGIRAISVGPGPVDTPILRDFRATMPFPDDMPRFVATCARTR